MNIDLEDKHIVVTGGTGSLGKAVVELLLESGATCTIPLHDPNEVDGFPYSSDDRVQILKGFDLANEEQTEYLYKDAANNFGSVWGSIHTAGGFGMGNIEDTGLDEFMQQFNINTLTCYNCCRSAIRHMRKSGQGGRIVNVASRPALEPRQGKGMSAYATSKAAVAALTQALAEEVVSDNILINAVAPSIIDTKPNREAMSGSDFEKWPKPKQIARQMLYLVSPANEVTRGSIVTVYGKS